MRRSCVTSIPWPRIVFVYIVQARRWLFIWARKKKKENIYTRGYITTLIIQVSGGFCYNTRLASIFLAFIFFFFELLLIGKNCLRIEGIRDRVTRVSCVIIVFASRSFFNIFLSFGHRSYYFIFPVSLDYVRLDIPDLPAQLKSRLCVNFDVWRDFYSLLSRWCLLLPESFAREVKPLAHATSATTSSLLPVDSNIEPRVARFLSVACIAVCFRDFLLFFSDSVYFRHFYFNDYSLKNWKNSYLL